MPQTLPILNHLDSWDHTKTIYKKKEFSTLRYDYEFFLIYFQNVADDSHAGPSEEEHVGENDEENDEEPPGNLPPEEAVTSKFNHAHHVRWRTLWR